MALSDDAYNYYFQFGGLFKLDWHQNDRLFVFSLLIFGELCFRTAIFWTNKLVRFIVIQLIMREAKNKRLTRWFRLKLAQKLESRKWAITWKFNYISYKQKINCVGHKRIISVFYRRLTESSRENENMANGDITMSWLYIYFFSEMKTCFSVILIFAPIQNIRSIDS